MSNLPVSLNRNGCGGDARGMPWRKSRAVPQKYTLGARFRHENRGIPRKRSRIGTSAKAAKSAQQESTRSRHSLLRRPSPIPATSVGRLGFCARIFPSRCTPRGGSTLARRFPSLRAWAAEHSSLDGPTLNRPAARQPNARAPDSPTPCRLAVPRVSTEARL